MQNDGPGPEVKHKAAVLCALQLPIHLKRPDSLRLWWEISTLQQGTEESVAKKGPLRSLGHPKVPA